MAIKYKWLAGHLREQLPDYTANGIHRLPTEAAISQRYKVSRQTVRQALSVLEQEGLIEKRQSHWRAEGRSGLLRGCVP